MSRPKLSPFLRPFAADKLVDEALEAKMDAFAQRPDVAAIQWRRRNHAGDYTRLYTVYGKLEVCHHLSTCWMVMRDGVPLVHAFNLGEALFMRKRAAMAAGLAHLREGYGDQASYQDNLCWKVDRQTVAHRPVQVAGDLHFLPAVPDDREWGRRRLDQLLRKSGVNGGAADENLMLNLGAAARSWQLARPIWTQDLPGLYRLSTPYGILVVRRQIGWTVERNGVPLVWSSSEGKRVIFDKLEHAKVSALLHAQDYRDERFVDGTRWDEISDEELAAGDEPSLSPAEGGNDHVLP